MKPLLITETAVTPKIQLDSEKGIFDISGRSLAENPIETYRPVMQWISAYSKEPNNSTLFVFKLDHFNTASSKALLDILSALAYIKNVKILWYYREDDEDIKEAGEEFFELVNIPFEFKTY